jgi:hypothetical protein
MRSAGGIRIHDWRGDASTTQREFWRDTVKIPQLLIMAVASSLGTGAASAYDLNFGGTDYGRFKGRVFAQSILSAKDNGWDPSSGSAYSLMGKYLSPSWNGFQFAAAAYLNGDLFGATDFDPKPGHDRTAMGMFIGERGARKGQLNQVNLTFKNQHLSAFAGRGQIDSPLTKNTYNFVPNSYTALLIGGKPVAGLEVSLGQVTQMAFGSRAMTDYGFIGEATGTGGAAQLPNQNGLGQAKFLNLGQVALGPEADNTAGLTIAKVAYSGLPNTKIALWNLFTQDIANTVYLDVETKIPLQGLKLDLGAQYLRQDDTGDALAQIAGGPAIQANFGRGELDYSLFGLKAGVIGAKQQWTFHALWNSSDGDTAFFNAFGGDPAYTSSIFSRNAYRQQVDAWGLRGSYQIMPGLRFIAGYYDYGQSQTMGAVPNLSPLASPTSDARELDLVLVYKPKQFKGLMIKTFYVNRTSEYDDYINPISGKQADATMSHWRLMLAYSF